MPFVKLDCKILDSSIWMQDSDTRVVWITLLAMADSGGVVSSTIPGIARRSGVSVQATEDALKLFEQADGFSKSVENEGRRIERIDGGYLILNYEKYRERDHSAAERVKRYREKSMLRRNVTLRYGPSASESVLEYLNTKTKKNYRNTKEIEARIRDGYTPDQLKHVIDVKCSDPYFQENPKYLNPVTLFRKSHIDAYVNQSVSDFRKATTVFENTPEMEDAERKIRREARMDFLVKNIDRLEAISEDKLTGDQVAFLRSYKDELEELREENVKNK